MLQVLAYSPALSVCVLALSVPERGVTYLDSPILQQQ